MFSECSSQIEMSPTSTIMLEERIPIIKEQAMSTPNFSGQAELGSASTLMTKEVLGSTPWTGEVTMTLELLSQEEQGTTANPTYSSRNEYKIATTLRKEMNPV